MSQDNSLKRKLSVDKEISTSCIKRGKLHDDKNCESVTGGSSNTGHVGSGGKMKKKKKRHREISQTGDELSVLEDTNISMVSHRKLKKKKKKKHRESLRTDDKSSPLTDTDKMKEKCTEIQQSGDELSPMKAITSMGSNHKFRKEKHGEILKMGDKLSPFETTDVSNANKPKKNKYEERCLTVDEMCSLKPTTSFDESVSYTENKKKKGKKNKKKRILDTNESSSLQSDTISISSEKSKRKKKNGKGVCKDEDAGLPVNNSDTELDAVVTENHNTCNNQHETTEEKTDELLNVQNDVDGEVYNQQSSRFESWDTSCLCLPEEVSTILHKNTLRVTEDDKKDLSDWGVKFRTGRFTTAEDNILKQNFNNYLQLYPIDEPWKLLFSNQTENCKYYRQICHQTNFYIHLAGNLNRHVQSCYFRARKIIPRKFVGQFNNEDSQTLQTLVNMFGTNWVKIALELGRDVQQVRDHYRYLQQNKNDTAPSLKEGKWTKTEEEQLVAALKGVTETEDLNSINNDALPWTKIAEKVPTRSKKQCRSHWLITMKGRKRVVPVEDGQQLQRNWEKQDTKDLINRIYNMEVDFEDEIDWTALMEYFPNAGTTCYLQKRWHTICQSLPNVHQKTFDEIRERLYTILVKEGESDSEGDDILP